MKNNTWLSLAQHNCPDAPSHEIMREANALCKLNEPNQWEKPFPPVDIGFAELMHFIQSTGTQREKDLVYATNLFHKAWSSLHVRLAVLKENLSPASEEEVHSVYAALTRLGNNHLLTENLPKKWVKWLNFNYQESLIAPLGTPRRSG